MKFLKLLLVTFFCVQMQAQHTHILPQKASEVAVIFSRGGNVNWELPMQNGERLAVTWQERQTSFSGKGFRSFVGYAGEELIGSASVYTNPNSGEVRFSVEASYNGVSIHISTLTDGFLQLSEQSEDNKCGVKTTHKHETARRPAYLQPSQTPSQTKDPLIFNNEALMVYRLAIPVSHQFYVSKFHSDVQEVMNYWASLEIFLNEIFIRDIGVKFKIVADEKLIYKDNDSFFGGKSSHEIVQISTAEINKLIGENAYDLGIGLNDSRIGTHVGGACRYFRCVFQTTERSCRV